MKKTPTKDSYDVVIIGGAMMGSSAAWFLSNHPAFDGSILVVERDPTYEWCSTAHTSSCIRQQFSTRINIEISQYGASFIRNFRDEIGDAEAPDITLQSFGYMYLTDNEVFAEALREVQELQASLGAGTKILTPDEILSVYPFYNLDGIVLGSHNTKDEGYFDGHTIFQWWRKKARENGVEYVENEVVDIAVRDDRIASVTLKTGETIPVGTLVNASGTRGARTARMAGLDIPVEPRRRYTFIIDCATDLPSDLPLTIDPSGVYVRTDGRYYMTGASPDPDPAVDFDDFTPNHAIFEEKIWPAIANRVPAFEAVKVVNSWVGHYAYNTLDQNAIVGPHTRVGNFIFMNGFSGHGFQQSPAMGRGVAELIATGGYETLDLSDLSFHRIEKGEPFLEKAII
ncbi:MAG: FAD-binding oxidoreductase [Pseudomonadota bacterium]